MSAGTPNKPTTASPLTRTPLPAAICLTTHAAHPQGATSPPGTTRDAINMVLGPLPAACCTVNDVADATSPPGFAQRPRHARHPPLVPSTMPLRPIPPPLRRHVITRNRPDVANAAAPRPSTPMSPGTARC
ncbi:hypothetical protein HYPSUDRAFT_209840 [Hypholoma sublateritium FD-334 SS-4]|uniref:Uncharacterized protein n=1 Tax=Hypholoma sublateritium (strain FD-334 SS-4) TaxID=945553 RepID=A0A0D2N8R4_HYPSF|nr:hypothetical protein HYPSUDRAFT_209840 [Hypholoma sublateritium FD-334 SS-4]